MDTSPPNPTVAVSRRQGSSTRTFWLCLLLILTIVAVYAPVVTLDFVNYDDPDYVTSNPRVQAGFTLAGVNWAFTRVHGAATYWHPLTWMSHMLDCQFFGLKPAGHHMVNLLFHTLNTVLVFLVFKRLTRAFWHSAALAALFGLHPLQVDTVAWIAERKNLLGALFWLLTMWAYTCYAQCGLRNAECGIQASGASTFRRSVFYLLSLALFALGLMCKPVLVTLPCVLLLLDYWPLRRLQLQRTESAPPAQAPGTAPTQHATRNTFLFLEKLPFLALSAASCIITLMAHEGLGLLQAGARLPLGFRVENALVSYARYVGKTVWPVNLTVLYPLSHELPMAMVALAGLFLLGVSVFAVWKSLRRPWLPVGWFWFFGVLVPFIGLVQAGAQAMADRFMYLPLIGLLILLVWGVAESTSRWAGRFVPLALGTAAVLMLFALAVGKQLRYWQNTETLFRHALAVTRNNYIAYDNLGYWCAQRGQLELAKKYYKLALEISPTHLGARNNFGWALVRQRRYVEAIVVFQELLGLRPQSAEAHGNLGAALCFVGRNGEAIEHLQEATRLDPENALAHYNLGLALLNGNKLADAAAAFARAAELNPLYAEACNNLGSTLAKQGKLDEAAAQFRRALSIQPDLAPARYGLGEVLAEQGKLDEAVANFREVVRLQPDNGPAWAQIGSARMKQGSAAEAAEAFTTALKLNPADMEARSQLAAVLCSQGRAGEAVEQYRAALKLSPDVPALLNNLAWLLAANQDSSVRNGREAVELAQRACKLTDDKQPQLLGTLAAAYAEAGRFPEAVATAEKAAALAEQDKQAELAARNKALAERYRSGQPARDVP